MGIFSGLKDIFKKKPKEGSLSEEISKAGLQRSSSSAYGSSSRYGSMSASTAAGPSLSTEAAASENIKARLDLLLTQLDSMRIQHEALNEKIDQIERMLKEILGAQRHF